MDDKSYLEDLQRITARMNQVHLANALVRKGQFSEALQLLRNVREKYTEPAMIRQIELLIRDVQARAAMPNLAPAEPPAPSAVPGGPPLSTETRHTPRSALRPNASSPTVRPAAPGGSPSGSHAKPGSPSGSYTKPDAAGALARARHDLANVEETIARARAVVERNVERIEQERLDREGGGAK